MAGLPDLALRTDLADACRILAAEGQEHFHLGHASVRVPQTDRFWIKPDGLALGEMTPDAAVLTDVDGNRIAGERPFHRENAIHAAIYRARTDVGAVVHTHPPNAVAFSATDAEFAMVSQDSVLFHAGIGRYDVPRLVVNEADARRLAAALGRHDLVLMRWHGISTAAPSLASAVMLAVSFERSLHLQRTAQSLGTLQAMPAEYVPGLAEDLGVGRAERLDAAYAALRRRLEHTT